MKKYVRNLVKTTPPIVLGAALLITTVAIAATVVYFMVPMPATISVGGCLAPISLWESPDCIVPVTEITWESYMTTVIPPNSGSDHVTEWIEIYVKNDAEFGGDEHTIFLHWILPSCPNGVTAEFQKWRHTQGIWDGSECEFSTEIMGSSCDGSYGTASGGGCLFRFRLTILETVPTGELNLAFKVYTASGTVVTG